MAFNTAGPVAFYGGPSNVTATLNTSRDPEVGQRAWFEGREYVFVYNDSDTQISPGYAAVLQSAATGYSVCVSSVSGADIVVGVCRNATLTTNTYGWLVTKGITPVEMGANYSAAAGDPVYVSANGVFDIVSNTTGNLVPAIGKVLEAAASGASGSAYICCY